MKQVESIVSSLESVGQGEFAIEALDEILDPEWVEEAIDMGKSRSRRRRKLPAGFMVYFVILLGLYRRKSYLNLLEKLHCTRWTQGAWGEGLPPTTRAVTEARDRLGVETMAYLFLRSAIQWELATEGRMLAGLRCYALDGVCMKTPDSDKNREHFGLPGASRGRTGFPQMRATMLVDVATHQVRAERHGPFHEGELTLAWNLLEDTYPGMLVIMDRNFHSYAHISALIDRGAGVLVRAKKKKMKARAYAHLGTVKKLLTTFAPNGNGGHPMRAIWKMLSYSLTVP